MLYDVIVIGGSYSGMAAALQLARARRQVLILDTGLRRNRFASSSHGLLGQDGHHPAEIAATAKAQLLAYPTVTWVDSAAVSAEKQEGIFTVYNDQGNALRAARLILASGVKDELPAVPGLGERWGTSVFHCPYCHGYELDQGKVGVLAVGEVSMHHALLLPDWGETMFFLNGTFEPDEEQRRQLASRGVSVEAEAVSEVFGEQVTVKLESGRVIELAGLFVASRIQPSNSVAESLGCELGDSPLGPYISTDSLQETSVSGVFACGDVARPAGNVTFAISDGVMAGTAAHRSLIWGALL